MSIRLEAVYENGVFRPLSQVSLSEGERVGLDVTVFANGEETDRPMTPREIAETLAAMARVEPFDMTPEDRAAADAWEKQVNARTVANLDKGIEDVFR